MIGYNCQICRLPGLIRKMQKLSFWKISGHAPAAPNTHSVSHGQDATTVVRVTHLEGELSISQPIAGGASSHNADTFFTLGGSSCQTPDPAADNAIEANAEVISPPQQPFPMTRFDTLKEAEMHYRMYAKKRLWHKV